MKKIVILLPDLRGGGAERMRIALQRDFSSRGYDVSFAVMRKEGELLAELDPNVIVDNLHAKKFRNLLIPLILFLKKKRPDALLVAMWPLTSIAIWAAKLAGVSTRVVISDHSILSISPQAQSMFSRFCMAMTMRFSYRWANSVVGVSHGVVNDISKLSGLVGSKKLFTIYNPAAKGVLPKEMTIDPVVSNWLNANPKIISVGTLKVVKKHSMLLDAFFRILVDKPDAGLLILGEGELRFSLEKQIVDLSLGDNVLMPGFVSDPYPYYMAADLFVLTSEYEGFGNVIVEAMECGLPVVSTDCESGPREILDGERFGRLVPVGDVNALTAAMLLTLDSKSDPEQQKKRAREFSVEKSATAYLALLDPEGVFCLSKKTDQ